MSEDILFERRGRIGLVTLNRPKALNALTTKMCVALHQKLDEWASDDAVKAVVITGAGEKAFCAGGDVVSLYNSGKDWKAGDKSSLAWQQFFKEEYRLNVAIKEFGKPYIAILDGITMGGGVGVSVHGSHLIVTENTVLAMPETGIGLIPDVGGSWFMPRLPDEVGLYLALSGDRVHASGLMTLGLAKAYVPRNQIGDLIVALSENVVEIDEILKKYADSPGPSRLAPKRGIIRRCFKRGSVEEIFRALRNEGEKIAHDGDKGDLWALDLRKKLMAKSPTSMKITFRQMREGAKLDSFREVMKMEYRIVNRIIKGHDFYEGVRAVLLDKDYSPMWEPYRFEMVADDVVARCFAPLGNDELTFNN